jgi:predicted MFS family arabinose efflux permease
MCSLLAELRMKRILAITFLNFFISGALTLVIPLLLLERNIDLIEIGLVISALPLVFLIARLLMALIADLRGWNRFYLLLNWPSSLLSTLIYFIASSTPIFLVGKIVEALKESSYWAVNRTAIFSLSPKREEREATRNTGVLFLSTAVGSVASGFAISYFGFSITLGFLIVVASAIGFPAVLLWKSRNRDSELKPVKIRGLFKLRNYGRKFWFVSITLLFFGLAYYPLLNLLLPVFMAQQLGYSYLTIGVAYMLFNVIAAAIVFGALRFSLGVKRVILQSCIAMLALLLLTYSNSYFLGMFLALAVAEGLGMGFFESIIAKATKKKPSVSVDIGILHIPYRLAEFASLLYAGFIAQTIGYFPVFLASGIFFTIFSVLAFYLLRSGQKS